MSYCVSVRFDVHEEHIDAFRDAVRAQAEASLEEPGCSRFDVWVDDADPAGFYLYEIYTDRAAFDAHLASPHFAHFDPLVAPMVREKRIETYSTAIAVGS